MSESSSDRDPVEVLADEFVERHRRGERPSISEYTARYPEHAEAIQALFPALVRIEQLKPAPGEASGPVAIQPHRVEGRKLERLGDYRILREIGRGGMGIVYEAEQISLGRHVALKALPQQMLLDAKQKQRFEREAKAAAKLHHTNIVPVFGVGEEDGLQYYVMQFIQGLGLDQILDELRRLQGAKDSPSTGPVDVGLRVSRKDVSAADVARSLLSGEFKQPGDAADNDKKESSKQSDMTIDQPADGFEETSSEDVSSSGSGRLTDTFSLSASSTILPRAPGDSGKVKKHTYWHSVANIGKQVADALEHAHQQGVLHRDIKPANLLLDMQGNVWVTDFGLAKADDQQNITHSGDVLGTLRYMAPEVFSAKGEARSEIYSLGLTLYELLTLRPAYDAKDRNKLIKQVTTAEPARLEKVNRDIPRDLVTIVHKTIEKDPAHRYRSAQELAGDLQRFLDDEPIQARRISVTERFLRWARRNKAIATLTAVAVALLMIGSMVSLYFAIQSSKNADYFEKEFQRAEGLVGKLNTALGEQTKATQSANAARTKEEKAKEKLRRGLYVSDMNLARLLYNDGAIDQLQARLKQHNPEGGETDLRGFEWYYWQRACHLHAASFRSQDAPFLIAVSPDGKTVASAHVPSGINIYDNTTRTVVTKITINKAARDVPSALVFSPDGSTLLAVWAEADILRFETKTWTRLPNLSAHQPKRRIVDVTVASAASYAASVDDKGNIVVWDTKSWKPVERLLSKTGIWSLALSPDGKDLVAVLGSGEIAHASNWSSMKKNVTWTVVPEIKVDEGSGRGSSLACHPDGSLLAVGAGKRVLLFNRAFRLLHEFDTPEDVLSVAFTPDGSRLAAGTQRKNGIRVWNTLSRKLEATIKGHTKDVSSVAFARDGETLWSVGDWTVKVWDLARCQPVDTFPHRIGFHSKLAYSSDGRTLFVHCNDGAIGRWDVVGRKYLPDWNGGEPFSEVAFSDDGHFLAARSKQMGVLQVWDLARDKLVHTLPVRGNLTDQDLFGSGLFQPLAVARDGRTVAWTQIDAKPNGAVALARALGSNKSTKIKLVDREGLWPLRNVALSPDGKRMAAEWHDHTELWNLNGPKPVRNVIPLHVGTPKHSLVFSPDGKRLAIGSWSNDIFIHDAKTGDLLHTLRGHADIVTCLAFSPTEARLASGSLDTTVRIWDTETGDLLTTLADDPTGVVSVAFAPDGAALASCGLSGAVRIRDVTSSSYAEETLRLADDPRKKAIAYEQMGNWPKALEMWTEAIDKNPGQIDLRFSRARAALQVKCYDLAAEDFAAFIKGADDKLLARQRIARAYESAFSPNTPVKCISQAVELVPDDQHLRKLRAVAWLRKGQWEKAAADLTKALQIRPTLLGDLSSLLKKLAARSLVSSAEFEPVLWRYTFEKPSQGWEKIDFDDATWKTGPAPFGGYGVANTAWTIDDRDIWLRKEFSLSKEVDTPLFFLAFVDEKSEIYINGNLAARGGWVDSQFQLRYQHLPCSGTAARSLRVGKNVLAVHCRNVIQDARIDVGLYQVDSSRKDLVIDIFTQVLKIHPRNIALLNKRGGEYAQWERWKEAAADYLRAAELKSAHGYAWLRAAPLLIETGRPHEYHKLCSQLLEQFAETKDELTARSISRTCLLIPPRQEHLKAAMALAQKAVTLNPADAWNHYSLALAELRSGHNDKVIQRCDKILRTCLAPANLNNANYRQLARHTYFVQAMAYHHLKQNNKAKTTLLKAIALTGSQLPEAPLPAWWYALVTKSLRRQAETLISKKNR